MDVKPNASQRELAEARAEIEKLKTQLEACREDLRQAQDAERSSRQAAAAAAEELQQFVYAASHDLQEPLRTVSAYTQLLQREHSTGQAAEFAEFVITGATQMGRLVRDLLSYSRVRTEPRLEPVQLNAAVQRALLALSDRIRDAGAKVTAEELPEVLADESQIGIVFEHLIQNAITYCSEAPCIQISAEEGPDACTVSVQDNGPGIEPEFHQQVFQAFKRLHGKGVSGTGLGLTTCRKIVRAHGGEIWVESDGKHGSVFKFTLQQ